MNIGVGLLIVSIVAFPGLHYARTVLRVSEQAAASEPSERNLRAVRQARAGIWIQVVMILGLAVAGIALVVTS